MFNLDQLQKEILENKIWFERTGGPNALQKKMEAVENYYRNSNIYYYYEM